MMEESPSIQYQLLQAFTSVNLLDSTYINLPPTMREQYRGYGSSYRNKTCKTQAGLKLQLVYNYLNQVITSLHIQEGISSDQGCKDYLDTIAAQQLIIADLGYFVPASFKLINDKKAYFLSRYKIDTNLYDPLTKQKVDLASLLEGHIWMLKELLLSSQTKLSIRVICYKLTPEQSAYRRRKANKLARSSGYTALELSKKLLDWAIFITNIPYELVADEHISKLYRVRWQIGLLFKLYKSYAGMEQLAGQNPYRIMCQLYAKLIGVVIFQSLANCLRLEREKKCRKALQYFKLKALDISITLSSNLIQLEFLLEKFLATSLKDNYHKKRPCLSNVSYNLHSIHLSSHIR